MSNATPTTEKIPEHIIVLGRQMIQSLLNQIDIWERLLGVSPRTSEIRRWYKRQANGRIDYGGG